MFDSKVTTSYTTGTSISLDANDALNFLTGLSITIINTVRDMIEVENRIGDKIMVNSDHDVMHLLEYYQSGIPAAAHSCIFQTNADILLKFVQDVVLNKTTEGLYLFYHSQNRKTESSLFDLILKALEDAHQYYMVHGTDTYIRDTSKHLNRYNKEFLELINS